MTLNLSNYEPLRIPDNSIPLVVTGYTGHNNNAINLNGYSESALSDTQPIRIPDGSINLTSYEGSFSIPEEDYVRDDNFDADDIYIEAEELLNKECNSLEMTENITKSLKDGDKVELVLLVNGVLHSYFSNV